MDVTAIAIIWANMPENVLKRCGVAAPTLDAQLWGTYVVVTSDERKRMGKVPRGLRPASCSKPGVSDVGCV